MQFVRISETKFDVFLSFSVIGLLSSSLLLYVSTDMSPGVLQVFVELGSLHETSNYVLYWIHGGHLFWFR